MNKTNIFIGILGIITLVIIGYSTWNARQDNKSNGLSPSEFLEQYEIRNAQPNWTPQRGKDKG